MPARGLVKVAGPLHRHEQDRIGAVESRRSGARAADVRGSLFIPKQPLAQHTACGKPSSAWRPLLGRWRMSPGHR